VTEAQDPSAEEPLVQQPPARDPSVRDAAAQLPLVQQPPARDPDAQLPLVEQRLAPEPLSQELAGLEREAASRRTSDRPPPGSRLGDGDASLLELVDRLTALLERSDLAELEVEAGGTGLVLRKPSALARDAVSAVTIEVDSPAAGAAVDAVPRERPSIKAPLTGIYYGSPAPGSAPFVTVGSEVAVGTVIGLIEAMKLFNEIKSDLAGRVVRIVAESGALVKAKQPLIEVEPL
jgi:acetyl-CoA carboxylase biotin carboxyl carrier protein